MVLNGIPINENECIGDSLQTINSAFQTLSANTLTLPPRGLSAIDSSTIDLSYNSTTGVLSASVSSINSFFTGANQNLSATGYQILPGGLIIQWGEISGNFVDDFTITLPITFPNRLFQAFGHDSGILTAPAPPIYLLNWYTSGGGIVGPVGTIRFRVNNSGGINYGNWLAIGY